MDDHVENYAEDATVGAGDVNYETGDAAYGTGDAGYDTGDAAYETGDTAYETGDAAYETGDGAFETTGMPEETGNVTEGIGHITGEVDDSHDLKQEHPDVSGTDSVEKRWPGWPGESVFRILIPAHKVGGLIGRKGEFIKKMCEETRARIKILEAPKGVPERAVIISAKEEPDLSLPPAIDGLLRVHKRIIDGLDAESTQVPPVASNVGPTRLLVAATQAGSLIGKQGATIKTIQEGSGSVVRVLENLPPIALQDDRVVEIQGEPSGMHKAVELIANHLRKFLVDRSVLPLFEKNMSMPNMHMEHSMPPPHPWAPPQGVPPNAGPPGYGSNPQFMPPRPHESYYPPPEYPPLEKQPHHGISMYGQNAPSMGANAPANQPKSMVSQVTHHMQIPLSYADAVIGAAGANISYIRRASGATITIQESRMAPGEMTVEITGSGTQVQTAEQLIQNFMADAAPAQAPPAPAPAQNTMGPADQSYNSYQAHGSVYGSQQSSAASAHMGGGYGSTYGTNYGY